MSTESLFQTLLFGVFVGCIYGIAAMGLSLVFGVLKVLNVAHGELLMLGGYASYMAFDGLGVDPYASLAIVIPLLFLIGILLDRAVYRHMVKQQGEDKLKNSLLVSFGLSLVLQNLAQWTFTADERAIQLPYAGSALNIAGVVLPYTRLASVLLALIVALALGYFLHRTYPGKAVLATAEDWEAAELAGIDVARVYMLTFGLGAALAAIAGMLVTVTYGIAPGVGMIWTLKALIVIVLAGTGSVIGTLPAGILLGLVEGLSGAFIGTSYRELVGLFIFLVVLVVRPKGLFGGKS